MTRLYTDKEIGSLIKRATELQDAAAESESGLSLDEIEALAGELGIEPEHLRAAALDLEGASVAVPRARLLGGPFTTDLKRVVEGDLTDETWEEAVQVLRSLSGSVGSTNEMGKSREWSRVIAEFEHLHVGLSPHEGKTTIRLRESYRSGAFLAYMLTVFFGGAAAGVVLDQLGLSNPATVGIWVLSVLAACTGTRFALATWGRRQRARMTALVGRLVGVVGGAASDADEQSLIAGEPGSVPVDRPREPGRAAPTGKRTRS